MPVGPDIGAPPVPTTLTHTLTVAPSQVGGVFRGLRFPPRGQHAQGEPCRLTVTRPAPRVPTSSGIALPVADKSLVSPTRGPWELGRSRVRFLPDFRCVSRSQVCCWGSSVYTEGLCSGVLRCRRRFGWTPSGVEDGCVPSGVGDGWTHGSGGGGRTTPAGGCGRRGRGRRRSPISRGRPPACILRSVRVGHVGGPVRVVSGGHHLDHGREDEEGREEFESGVPSPVTSRREEVDDGVEKVEAGDGRRSLLSRPLPSSSFLSPYPLQSPTPPPPLPSRSLPRDPLPHHGGPPWTDGRPGRRGRGVGGVTCRRRQRRRRG